MTIIGVELPIEEGLVILIRVIVSVLVVTIVGEVTVTKFLTEVAVQLLEAVEVQFKLPSILKLVLKKNVIWEELYIEC